MELEYLLGLAGYLLMDIYRYLFIICLPYPCFFPASLAVV